MYLVIELYSSIVAFVVIFILFTLISKLILKKNLLKIFCKIWVDLAYLWIVFAFMLISLPVQIKWVMIGCVGLVYFLMFYVYKRRSIGSFIFYPWKEKDPEKKEINKKRIFSFLKNYIIFSIYVIVCMILSAWYFMDDGSFVKTWVEWYQINEKWNIIVDDDQDWNFHMWFFDETKNWTFETVRYDVNFDNKIDMVIANYDGGEETTKTFYDYNDQKYSLIAVTFVMFVVFTFLSFRWKNNKIENVATVLVFIIFFDILIRSVSLVSAMSMQDALEYDGCMSSTDWEWVCYDSEGVAWMEWITPESVLESQEWEDEEWSEEGSSYFGEESPWMDGLLDSADDWYSDDYYDDSDYYDDNYFPTDNTEYNSDPIDFGADNTQPNNTNTQQKNTNTKPQDFKTREKLINDKYENMSSEELINEIDKMIKPEVDAEKLKEQQYYENATETNFVWDFFNKQLEWKKYLSPKEARQINKTIWKAQDQIWWFKNISVVSKEWIKELWNWKLWVDMKKMLTKNAQTDINVTKRLEDFKWKVDRWVKTSNPKYSWMIKSHNKAIWWLEDMKKTNMSSWSKNMNKYKKVKDTLEKTTKVVWFMWDWLSMVGDYDEFSKEFNWDKTKATVATTTQTAISKTLWNNPIDAATWLASAWLNLMWFTNAGKTISKLSVWHVSKETIKDSFTTSFSEIKDIVKIQWENISKADTIAWKVWATVGWAVTTAYAWWVTVVKAWLETTTLAVRWLTSIWVNATNTVYNWVKNVFGWIFW